MTPFFNIKQGRTLQLYVRKPDVKARFFPLSKQLTRVLRHPAGERPEGVGEAERGALRRLF